MSKLSRILATELTPKRVKSLPINLRELERVNLSISFDDADNVKTIKTIKARKVNKYLAIHKSVDDESLWTVTHIPTGFSVSPEDITLKKAKLLASELVKLGDTLDFNDQSSIPPKVKSELISVWKRIK